MCLAAWSQIWHRVIIPDDRFWIELTLSQVRCFLGPRPASIQERTFGRTQSLISTGAPLARHWTAEQERIVRDTVERFIGMARAEQAADDRSAANKKETVVKLKGGKGDLALG
jgi:hypothetical protein